MAKIKYLVTSGCSFTDNIVILENILLPTRWPHFLSERLNIPLYNFGHGSAGNDYIASSIIYQTYNLLKQKISPEEIAIMVMWSGIEREGMFISKQETINYDSLINKGQPNPVNFIDMHDVNKNGRFVPIPQTINSGWLFGAPTCGWDNPLITERKKEYFSKFHTREHAVIKSLNYFLQLQWFCQSHNIKLINLTYQKILDFPRYRNIEHLMDMIDFSQWIFWKEYDGLYEYTRDNNLPFYKDNVHPLPESHKHFVENFLMKNHLVQEMFLNG